MNTRDVLMDSVETGVCVHCGLSHKKSTRLRLIRPLVDSDEVVPFPAAAIQEAFPCFYPMNATGERQVHRDLRALKRRTA